MRSEEGAHALSFLVSPVHGAFRAAVIGPPLTAGDGTRVIFPSAPFTGLLAVRL